MVVNNGKISQTMKMVSRHEKELLGLIERCIRPVIKIIIAMIEEYRNMNTIKTRYKTKSRGIDWTYLR